MTSPYQRVKDALKYAVEQMKENHILETPDHEPKEDPVDDLFRMTRNLEVNKQWHNKIRIQDYYDIGQKIFNLNIVNRRRYRQQTAYSQSNYKAIKIYHLFNELENAIPYCDLPTKSLQRLSEIAVKRINQEVREMFPPDLPTIDDLEEWLNAEYLQDDQ